MKCIICGKEIKGVGNNAQPLADGVCCNKCNERVLIMRMMMVAYQYADAKGKEHFKQKAREHNSDHPAVVGAKCLIVDMEGEPNYNGCIGTITHIDDAKQIHGTWGGCAIIPDTDIYIVL